MSLNTTALLLTQLRQRNGTRQGHRVSHTGQYNKSEHCTRRQKHKIHAMLVLTPDQTWNPVWSRTKSNRRELNLPHAVFRVHCTHNYLVHRRTVSLNESCHHVMGVGKTVSFPPGSGVCCRTNFLRRNWFEIKLSTTDSSLVLLTSLA